jgi:hypothetical protein
LADLLRQTIVDFGVTRDRSFGAVGRISVYRMASAFAIQLASMALQVIDPLMPPQTLGAPT